MAKLTGAKKREFLARMAKGRKKASRKNGTGRPRKKARAKAKANPKRKNKKSKLTGKKKAEFLRRMARGRRKAAGKNPRRKAARKNSRARSRAPKRNTRRRRNQETMEDAEHMFETFHGKHRGQIVEYEELVKYPDRFAELGELRELRFHLDSANPDFPLTRFGESRVVCTPDGENIYFVGGDQSVDLGALNITSSKDTIDLGACTYIAYKTVKDFHDFAPTIYWHRFGEEDGILPTLAYDTLNKRLLLLSGNYRVKREGIVN